MGHHVHTARKILAAQAHDHIKWIDVIEMVETYAGHVKRLDQHGLELKLNGATAHFMSAEGIVSATDLNHLAAFLRKADLGFEI